MQRGRSAERPEQRVHTSGSRPALRLDGQSTHEAVLCAENDVIPTPPECWKRYRDAYICRCNVAIVLIVEFPLFLAIFPVLPE